MANVDDFSPLLLLAHFGTLLATYLKGTPSSMHIIDEYMRACIHPCILHNYSMQLFASLLNLQDLV